MTRMLLLMTLIGCAGLAGCRAPVADTRSEEVAVRQVFDSYIMSVNAADAMMAEHIWLQSPDLVVITPFGRFQGWERVREEVYVKFLKQTFSERDLRPSNVSMQVMGDSAWLAFDWAFTAKLANGQPITSKGWESHVYRKTDRGWRIAHLHYSVPPPPPPAAPAP